MTSEGPTGIVYRPTKNGNLQWRKAVGASTIVFQIGEVRRINTATRTGTLGRVKLVEIDPAGEQHPLYGHVFDVDNARDIIWLAGKAHEQLNSTKADYDKKVFEQDLVNFCDGVWQAWVSNDRVSGLVAGDSEPSMPRWAVPGLILFESPGIHFGDAKSGKSTFDRLIAQSLQYDCPLLFPTLAQGNVVWVNAEEPPQEHSRQFGNVNAALGIERTAPVYTVDARGLSIFDAQARIRAAVEKREAEHVFVDSLSRLAQGANLNENATATMLMDSLSGTPASATWIGHTGNENRHRLAGSKHFVNAARVTVRIQGRIRHYGSSPELFRGLRVQMADANGAAPVPPQYFSLEYHRDFGLKSISRAEESEWPTLHCEVEYEVRGKKRTCGRSTWDGVVPGRGIRCDRHRIEEDGGSEPPF